MTSDSTQAHRYEKIAAFITIITGLALIGLSIWGGPIFSTGDDVEMSNPSVAWLLQSLSGALAIASVGVAQSESRRGLGRMLLLGAAGLLLASLSGFSQIGPRALLTVISPTAVMLAASIFVGPLAPAARLTRGSGRRTVDS